VQAGSAATGRSRPPTGLELEESRIVSERERVLIVEGDEATRKLLREGLSRDHDVCAVDTIAGAIEAVRRFRPDVMTLDGTLERGEGGSGEELELLRLARKARLRLKIIVVAPSGDRDLAVRAIELGACDCCVKPFDIDEFGVLVKRALRIQELETAADAVPDRLSGVERLDSLAGTCRAMQEVFSSSRKVAATDVGVLLVGERGTGRELIARGIHHLSRRSRGPFVAVDLRATPTEFLEAEVFGNGNGNGTFNGAEKMPGRIEQADGGTLFIMGVDELSQHLQARLSAFIQSGEIERKGSHDLIEANVRIIAAADDGLDETVAEGGFREDLYYQLSVVTVALPPLRERGEDIALLAEDLLERCAVEHERRLSGFTRSAVRAMMAHVWPGNIPELENRVRRAVIMSSGHRLTAADLGLDSEMERRAQTLGEAKDALEHEIVVDALTKAAGNVSRAARSIGVSRSTVYDLIRKYEIDVTGFKALARRKPREAGRSENLDPRDDRPRAARGSGDLDSTEA